MDRVESTTVGAAPKPAAPATRTANEAVANALPFHDRRDFENARRGLIAPLPESVIRRADGRTVWDIGGYGFAANDAPAPDTVNPSLWRQLQLLTIAGLFQVTDRVYQVRGCDLSNIAFVEGDTGLIVIDALISAETARAALDLYFQHRPRRPVVAVIHTHSHIDHYGGVKGIVAEEDVRAGKVRIVAPEGFLEKVVSENVMAGNAMTRRASYMYGALLPRGPRGQASAGLGLTTSSGTVTLIEPTDTIARTGDELTIDGVRIVFQYTPGTEAPAEMNFLFPGAGAARLPGRERPLAQLLPDGGAGAAPGCAARRRRHRQLCERGHGPGDVAGHDLRLPGGPPERAQGGRQEADAELRLHRRRAVSGDA
jgi:alkyl sulfatase BDS1-like metallo-beta-lactamase superfamily hydrolase